MAPKFLICSFVVVRQSHRSAFPNSGVDELVLVVASPGACGQSCIGG